MANKLLVPDDALRREVRENNLALLAIGVCVAEEVTASSGYRRCRENARCVRSEADLYAASRPLLSRLLSDPSH